MMRVNNISFPKLNISFDINPVAIDISLLGGVRWYGILIALGIMLAFLYCNHIAKKEGEKSDVITDIILYALPVSIIFARTYYVLFSWESYKGDFFSVFKIWEGGIAIYGAVIGAILSAFIYCKVKKLNVLKIFDICSLGLLIGQIVGRWGNFVNAEAFGGYCDYLWGMSINGGAPVHPTFLYESLWNLIGVLGVYLFARFIGKKYDGQLILLTFGWYGLGRMFIEGLRTDSLYIPGTAIRISQALAAVIFVVFLALLIFFAIKKPKKPLYIKVAAEGEKKTEKSDGEFFNKIKALFTKKPEANSNNKDNKNDES